MSSAATTLDAYAYWPENPFWSFQLLRLIEQTNVGGADFAELHGVARELPEGDAEAWWRSFGQLAARLEAQADGDMAAGHRVTAREAYLRASNYHRTSGFFLSPADPRHGEAVLARRRCFAAGATLSETAIEAVEIPYGETTLPGYRFGPVGGAASPGPAAIVFGGRDPVAEEMWFFIGRALAERGFTVLAMDGPGQGEALRRGIVGRHDWEVPVGAAVDSLVAREDVDAQQIVLIGQSLGGYYRAGRRRTRRVSGPPCCGAPFTTSRMRSTVTRARPARTSTSSSSGSSASPTRRRCGRRCAPSTSTASPS